MDGTFITSDERVSTSSDDIVGIPAIHNLRKRLDDEFSRQSLAHVVKEQMEVFLRIRPLSEAELRNGEDQHCLTVKDHTTLITRAPKDSKTYRAITRGASKTETHFTFSKIFHKDTTQREIFNDTMEGKVKAFIEGQNGLIFTYGVTNSGKTYTILGLPEDAGILPRSLDIIFNTLSGKILPGYPVKPKMFCSAEKLTSNRQEIEQLTKDMLFKESLFHEYENSQAVESTCGSSISADSLQSHQSSVSSSQQISMDSLEPAVGVDRHHDSASLQTLFHDTDRFSIWVSYVEIYNEQMFDLLVPPPKCKKIKRQILHLKDDSKGLPFVRGLKEVCVHTSDEACRILDVGKRNLRFAATRLNHNSSRSHCIFTVKLIRVADEENPNFARVSMLSFCDLAGTERYTKTGSIGDRIKEAGNINTSLLTLGRCMKMLRDNQHKSQKQLVPFRDSKLTRLFQCFFTGQGLASMIVNVNQCASMFDETLQALKYSSVAREVIITVDEKPAPPPPKRKKRGVLSLALAQNEGNARITIGWASPRLIAAVQEGTTVVNHDLEEADDDILLENAEVELTVCPKCKPIEMAMIKIIEDQLAENKEKNEKLKKQEIEIREELTDQFTRQMVALEQTYKEQFVASRLMYQQRMDSKCEHLAHSIKKRKREEQEELEIDRRAQINELERLLAEAREEVLPLQQDLLTSQQTNEELQTNLTKISFENAVLQKKLLSADKSAKENVKDILTESQEMIEKLQERLHERDERLTISQEEINQKDEIIQKLQEEINQKDEIIQKLQDAMSAHGIDWKVLLRH